MHFDFFESSSQLVEELRAGGPKFGQVIAKGVLDATKIMFEGSRTLLSELIYNRPIPVRARFRRLKNDSGGWRHASEKGTSSKKTFFGHLHSARQSNAPAWRRTSTLLRGERFYLKGSGALTTGIIDNKTPYAKARHDLNRAGKDGITRSAHWRTEAAARYGDRSLAAMRAAINAFTSGTSS